MKNIFLILLSAIILSSSYAQSPGEYYIQAIGDFDENKAITYSIAPEEAGSVWIESFISNKSHALTLQLLKNDYYNIETSTGLYLNIKQSSDSPYGELVASTLQDNGNFKWYFSKSKGGYIIKPKSRGYLNINSSVAKNPTLESVAVFREIHVEPQIWKLVPTSKPKRNSVDPRALKIMPIAIKKYEVPKPVEYRIEVSVDRISNVEHNNDCNRLQGNIKINLKDKLKKKHYPISDNNDIIVAWNGNKSRDFVVRKELYVSDIGSHLPYSAISGGGFVEFTNGDIYLDEDNIRIELSSSVKGCHKGGEGQWDYNCDINYSGSFSFALKNLKKSIDEYGIMKYSGPLTIKARKNRRPDPHRLTIYVDIYISEKL